jgi:metal-responsive CopG/Arc/MetJ family transcriptional regulator
MPPSPRALQLLDMSDPQQAMHPISLKLPPQMIEALDQTAKAYRSRRSVVIRSLLAQALEQLKPAADDAPQTLVVQTEIEAEEA